MRSLVLTVVLLVFPAVASAQVAPADTDWVAFGAVGFDPPLSGNVTSAVTGNLSGAPLVLGGVSFSGVYGTLARWEFGGGYRIDSRSEVLAKFSYSSGGGSRAALGVTPGLPYVGEFESIAEKSFQLGYRRHLATLGPFRPYVGGWGGFTRTNSITAPLTLPGASDAPINLPVLDASAAGLVSGGGGLLLPLTSRVALNVDANLQWRTSLNSANVLVGTGLDNIGDETSRWSFPVVFGVVVQIGAERVP